MNARSLPLYKIYRYENYIINQSASWFTADTYRRLGINDGIRLWSQLYGCRKRFFLWYLLLNRKRRITFIGGTISFALCTRDKKVPYP